MDKRMDDVLYQ